MSKERLAVDKWNSEYGIWDSKKEKFIGSMFFSSAEADFFLKKLNLFLKEYEPDL